MLRYKHIVYEKYLFASLFHFNIDPSDLSYTPSQMESFEMRRFDIIDSSSTKHQVNDL